MHVFTKALWDERRSLPAWASAVAGIILLESALWPSLSGMSNLDAYLEELPAGLKEVFALDQMSTGTGFLNAELFTLLLPALFVVHGISRGARMVAGEEERGTLDLLLVTPLPAWRLLLEAAAALITSTVTLAAVALSATLTGSLLFGLGIPVASAVVGVSALALLGTQFGIVALVVGAATGRRGLALGVSAGLVMAAYLWFVAGMFVGDLEPWRGLSPIDQALGAGPIAPEAPGSFAWLLLPPVVALLLAVPWWDRRDIGRGR